MKKIIAFAFTACIFTACANSNNDEASTADSLAMDTQHGMDNMDVAYTPTDGDVTYRDGRTQIYRTDHWEDANEDVTFDNGIVIYRSGRVAKDNNEYEWEEGYVVDRRGNVWNRTGDAIADAWDATKHGVRKGAQAVGDAAERVGEKTKDIVNGKDRDKDDN